MSLKVIVTLAALTTDRQRPRLLGSNENSNGLPYPYLPKRTDLAVHSPVHLLAVQDELNRRVGIVLDGLMPTDLFNELLAFSTGQVL